MHAARVPELNKVLLAGRLVRDPELRFSSTGVGVASFTLALNRRMPDAKGEWQEETTFVAVTAFGRTAEVVKDHVRMGSAVLVEGRLHSRSWQGKDGKPRRVLEVRADRVQFLDPREKHDAGASEPGGGSGDAGHGDDAAGPHYIEGDLPF